MSSTAIAAPIVATYSLTPLQQGMLAQHLRAPGSGVDVEQLVCTLPERVDADALRRAWQKVVDRHDVLRTSIEWSGLDVPQQRVHEQVEVPFEIQDWRGVAITEREARFAEWLEADRARGFALDAAPLLRLTLLVLEAEEHRLVWTFHHAILDGRCFPMVLREVLDLYDAAQRGEGAPVPERRRPFREYVEWLGTRAASASDDFWRAYLAGVTSPTPIPVARAVAARDVVVQGDEERRVSAPVVAQLRDVAAKHGVTLSTIVQGAWSVVLSRYSGERDVVFGVTLAGRRDTVAGADEMLGLFIDTLPMRVDVRGEKPVGEWLRDVRAAFSALREHEHTPLARVHACSAVPAGQPLFDSLVMFESYELDASLRAQGGAWTRRGFRLHEQNGLGLTLAAYAGDELLLRLEFDRTRFEDDVVARTLAHVATALEGIAADPSVMVNDLSILPAAERERLLHEWAGERVQYDGGATLMERLDAQAAATPNAVAVEDERRALTFAELHAAASVVARELHERGVGRGSLVGVCAERSVELVVALVAVVKAGGAYVPLDPEYPRDRLAFMLEDSGVRVLLTTHGVAERLPASGAEVVLLDGVADRADERATSAGTSTVAAPTADDPAYMIYTSGSTGRPKGALNAHRGIVNRLAWMQQAFALTTEDVVLQKTPMSFDVSVWEFFWPLVTGAKLVLARPGGHKDPLYLADVIERAGVTVCHFVPSMLRAFVGALAGADAPREGERSSRGRLASLRAVMASGEALPPDLVAAWYHAVPGAGLHNLYGPTECAVDVSWWACPPSVTPPAVVPIGGAIANTRLYVLDARGGLAPIGVPGELYLAGVQVGLGYHNRPELTAERFVPDMYAPAGEGSGARMYRTGDLARWRADGTVEYLGRLDFQVKIRGFRIELGEIETTLLRHPSVRDCVVDARTDVDGERRLVAYLVAAGEPPAASVLRAFLLETLPEHMVPGAFVALDTLPLSSNGKVDRRALPDPRLDRAARSRERVPPRSAAERVLAEIWSRVLRVERAGVTDDFFELGGDSLLSIQIVSQAARAGLRLTLTQVLQQPTIAGQAALATTTRSERDAPAPSVATEGEVPLTPVQRWFAELDTPDAQQWNQAFLFTVPALLVHERLRAAVAAVAVHHDALRLRFGRDQGVWRQWYASDAAQSVLVPRVDLSTVADGDVASAIAEWGEVAQRSLDLAKGPIGCAVHFDLGPSRAGRVLLVLHHLVVDGVSWRVLREDLESAYEQLGESGEVRLPSRTSSFAAWSAALTAVAASGALSDEIEHWQKTVARDGGEVQIPRLAALARDDNARDRIGEPRGQTPSVSDPGAGANVEGNVRVVEVALSVEETRDLLQRVPASYGTRVDDALVAALGATLGEWLGAGSIVVDLEGHGREEIARGVDVSRTVGWFTSVFPVRLELVPGQAPRTRLIEAKEMLRRVPRRGIGYGILRYLREEPALRDAVQPEVMFNYLGQFDQVVAGSKLFGFARESAGAWRSARAPRRHLLEIVALVIDGRMTVRLGYAAGLHDAATIERVADGFVAALRGCVAHCLAPDAIGYTPSDFPLAGLDQGALDRLFGGVRDVEDVYPATPLQRLFLDAGSGADDPGFQQYRFELEGPLDTERLREAWELVTARHDVLRTRFLREKLAPLTVVQGRVELPWRVADLRGVADAGARVDSLLADDRARGFDMEIAPLMRVTLVRLEDLRWTMVWTQHHLLLDRWSWPIVLREVGACYDALRRGEMPALRPAVQFREYVAWLAAQPDEKARAYWSEELADLGEPLRLLEARADRDTVADRDEIVVALTARETTAVRAVARAAGLSPNVLVESAWAMALAHLGARDDVTFGLAVDGRGAEVAGADEIVGVLVNNLPVRARLDAEERLVDWLSGLQRRQAALRGAEHAPLESIQRWIGLPWRHRLFETLLVFQDRAAEQGMSDWLGGSVAVRRAVTPTLTAYPITGLIGGDDRLTITVVGDRRLVPRALVEELAHAAEAALQGMTSGLDTTVGALRRRLPPVRPFAWQVPRVAAERVEPRSATERVLVRIWGELLGSSELGVTDNFFALGGHSLLATQIVSRVRETLQADIPVRLLFQHPTVADLATALIAQERKAGHVERVAQLVLRIEGMSAEELRRSAAERAARQTVAANGN